MCVVAPQAAPSFACFVGGALVDTWAGGSRGRLEAAVRRWGAIEHTQPSALGR
jgi:hypothetical protein